MSYGQLDPDPLPATWNRGKPPLPQFIEAQTENGVLARPLNVGDIHAIDLYNKFIDGYVQGYAHAIAGMEAVCSESDKV